MRHVLYLLKEACQTVESVKLREQIEYALTAYHPDHVPPFTSPYYQK